MSLRRLNAAMWALGFVALAMQAYFVFSTVVELPWQDEWELFAPSHSVSAELDLPWLFRFHNEHRIVTTRLLVWAMHATVGWSVVAQVVVSYLVFVFVAALALRTFERWFDAPLGLLLPAFASSVAFEAHLFAFNIQFHLFLAFFLLALIALRRGGRAVFAVAPSALASAYSLSAGLVAAAAVAVLCGVLAWRRPPERRALVLQALIVALGLGLYFIGYPADLPHPPWTPPTTGAFWLYLANALSLGFGYGIEEPWSGLGALVLIASLSVWRWRRRAGLAAEAREPWLLLAGFGLALLGVLALVAVSRAGFGIAQAKSPRYAELGLFVLPALWLLARAAIHARWSGRARLWAMIVAAAVLLAGYVDDFNWHRWAAPARGRLAAASACVRRVLAGEGDGRCEAVLPRDLRPYLERARALALPFVRVLEK